MKSLLTYSCAIAAVLLAGCATQRVEDCCSNARREVVYVDKAVSECTRSVQRITQTSPCAVCERFPVTARLEDGCPH